MLDLLRQVCDEAGRLLGVEYALFEGDPGFVTGIGLRFESLAVRFRAVSDDDSLIASLGSLRAEADEVIVTATATGPWPRCLGLGVCWGWQLTNQQGYSDGVRLEFVEPGREARAVVELIVIASAIRLSVAVGPAEAATPADRPRDPGHLGITAPPA
jgi:hypothetical protein